MKAIILAGGKGTRFAEETILKPKPMIEIGGRPILWHIMKTYAAFHIKEFIICLGYKGELIREYFQSYYFNQSDVTIDLKSNKVTLHHTNSEDWVVTLVETGPETSTGGRIKRIRPYIGEQTFMLTYGDGVGDIQINNLLASHNLAKKCVTLTAVQPQGRFGALSIDSDNSITSFVEKPRGDGYWINGGYFVCEPSIFDLIEDDTTVWEDSPLKSLARDFQLNAYKHTGFWHPMDKQYDKNILNQFWESGYVPWTTYWT